MWMKVDDRLHSHRKTRAVLKSGVGNRDAAPFGLWVLAGSWSAQNGTYGWVPCDELERWDDYWEALASRLVSAGYWWPQEKDGEAGYGFVDWADYNPSPEAASQSGSFGNHRRWHEQRGIVEPTFQHVPARRYLTALDDGLTTPWEGAVWCNPPYSGTTPWVEKWAAHDGPGLLLVPAVKSRWVGTMLNATEAMTLLTVEFHRPGGEIAPIRWLNILAAKGDDCVSAVARVAAVDKHANGGYLRGGAA